MDMNEIKKLKDEELSVESSRVRRALFDLKSQVVTEKVKDSSQFGKMRNDLARLLTEVSARRVAASPVSPKKVAEVVVVKKPVVKKTDSKKSDDRKKVKS